MVKMPWSGDYKERFHKTAHKIAVNSKALESFLCDVLCSPKMDQNSLLNGILGPTDRELSQTQTLAVPVVFAWPQFPVTCGFSKKFQTHLRREQSVRRGSHDRGGPPCGPNHGDLRCSTSSRCSDGSFGEGFWTICC